MCLMLHRAGNKRLEAEVYTGADIHCYYFPRIFFEMYICTTHQKLLILSFTLHFNLWSSGHVI